MTDQQPPDDARPIRASDDDRARVATTVGDAAAAGRLTLDEADERLSAAYGSVYRHELDRLVADLPADRRGRRGGGVPERRPDRRIAAVVIGAVVAVCLVSSIVHAAVGDAHGPHFPFLLLIPAVFIALRLGLFTRLRAHGWDRRSHVGKDGRS